MNDLRSLVPQSKHDIERANAAVAAGYPAVKAILPELLAWLQDYNWPVAHVLAPFLASIGAPLIPYIRDIMNTDDDMWKYWMMEIVMQPSREVASAFREELERIAYSPNEREIREELNEEAHVTLQVHGWHRTG